MAAPVYTSWKEQPSKNLGKLEAPALDWCLNVLVISQIQGLTGPPNRCLKPLWNHFETLESSTWRASIHPSTHSIRQYFWEYLSGKNPLIYSFSIRQYFWSILHDFDVFFFHSKASIRRYHLLLETLVKKTRASCVTLAASASLSRSCLKSWEISPTIKGYYQRVDNGNIEWVYILVSKIVICCITTNTIYGLGVRK